MIYFEATLFILGLIISLVTLIQKDIEKNKKTKKVLAFFYILICIISICILVYKNFHEKENNPILFETLGKIESSVNVQSDTILVMLERTIELGKKLDSINNKTEEAINQRKQNQKVFIEQNKMLKKANEFTEKRIRDESPYIEVLTHDITFSPKDEIYTRLGIIYTNLKIRSALKLESEVFIILRDIKGNDLGDFYNSQDKVLRPIYNGHQIISNHTIVIKYEDLLQVADGGLIQITVKFYDDILDEYFYYDLNYRMKVENNKIIAYMGGSNLEKEIQKFRNLVNKQKILAK
jgi:hypothetical protein